MKKFILLVGCIVSTFVVCAQDVIVLKNANEIQAKVISITPDAVTYKRWNNLEGPSYTIVKSDIFYIKYANGEKDIIQELNVSHTQYGRGQRNKSGKFTPVKVQGYGYTGAIFMEKCGGLASDVSIGCKLYDLAYLGIELGYHTMISEGQFYGRQDGYYNSYFSVSMVESYIPIGINLKGYLLRGRKVAPFINCSLGGFIGLTQLKGFDGFFCQAGAGIDIQRFSFGIGYSGLVLKGTAHAGYIKLGVRIGK